MKKKEIVQYGIWGILSTVLNIVLFQFLTVILNTDYRIANGTTLIIVKIFSYITNKLFVFQTPYGNIKHLLKEAVSFFVARGATFILDFVGVIVMVEIFKCDTFISKCFIAVIVIILNYVLSKKFVFCKK